MSRPDQTTPVPADSRPVTRNQNAPAQPGIPLQLSHADMNAAHRGGLAAPLGQTVAWIMRYHDAWWVLYEGGWLRITDDPAAADLDRLAARMTSADAYAARDAAIRAAVNSPAPPPSHP